MTANETQMLVGAVVAVLTALQVWLVNRAVVHGQALDGVMTGRIAVGAAAVVKADQAAQAAIAAPAVDPVKSARIAALRMELAGLDSSTA